MRIAICDDVEGDRRAVEESLAGYLKKRGVSAKVVEFTNPQDLLVESRTEPFDLYLLDVLLANEINGIEIVKLLRSWRGNVSVIFLSTSREYAVDAFAVEAVSYLQKPWTQELFYRALDRAMDSIRTQQEGMMAFKSDEGVVRFPAEQIEYVSTAPTVNYVVISRAGGNDITQRGSIRSFADQYGETAKLIPAGRSILINPAQISALEDSSVRFFSGRSIEVPRSVLPTLSKAILALSRP